MTTKPPADPDTGQVPLGEDNLCEVRDAVELLEFVVQTGYVNPEGQTVPRELVAALQGFAALTEGSSKPGENELPVTVAVADLVDFQMQYMALAQFTAPVTTETLRNTETGDTNAPKVSLAQKFTRQIWIMAIVFAVVIVAFDWGGAHLPFESDSASGWKAGLTAFASIIAPYLYGGLGASVYLLRSAHVYLYERSFDMRRQPEYFNRILLGTISGGAIVLFAETITTEESGVIHLSTAAFGFLAGYSTDFLFNTVERVIAAILPHVGVTGISRTDRPNTRTTTRVDVTLKDLLDRIDKSEGEDQKFYRSLVTKLF